MRAQTLVCVACTEQMRLRLPAQGWPGVRSRLQNRTQHRRQMHFNLQKSAGALASAVGMAAVAAPLRVLVCALQCQLCELVCARNVNCASVHKHTCATHPRSSRMRRCKRALKVLPSPTRCPRSRSTSRAARVALDDAALRPLSSPSRGLVGAHVVCVRHLLNEHERCAARGARTAS